MKNYYPLQPVIVNISAKYFTGTALMKLGQYEGGRAAIWLESADERICTLTSNVPEVPLGIAEFIVKTYSGNEGMLDQLLIDDIMVNTGRIAPSGHVVMPICRFSEAFIDVCDKAGKAV